MSDLLLVAYTFSFDFMTLGSRAQNSGDIKLDLGNLESTSLCETFNSRRFESGKDEPTSWLLWLSARVRKKHV